MKTHSDYKKLHALMAEDRGVLGLIVKIKNQLHALELEASNKNIAYQARNLMSGASPVDLARLRTIESAAA